MLMVNFFQVISFILEATLGYSGSIPGSEFRSKPSSLGMEPGSATRKASVLMPCCLSGASFYFPLWVWGYLPGIFQKPTTRHQRSNWNLQDQSNVGFEGIQ